MAGGIDDMIIPTKRIATSSIDMQAKSELAYNTNTPPEILTILAQDVDGRVRRRVAENPQHAT
jgi:hypothetical protein